MLRLLLFTCTMLAHVSVPPCCWFSEPRHNSNKTLTIHIRSLSSTSAVLIDCSSTLFVVGLSVCRSGGLSGSQREGESVSVCFEGSHDKALAMLLGRRRRRRRRRGGVRLVLLVIFLLNCARVRAGCELGKDQEQELVRDN